MRKLNIDSVGLSNDELIASLTELIERLKAGKEITEDMPTFRLNIRDSRSDRSIIGTIIIER